MKSKCTVILSMAMLVVVNLTSCKKERSDTAEFRANMLSFINGNQPEKYKVTVSATTGGSIIGANTRVYFSPNAFVSANGTAVTGDVELEVQEVYTKAQMILSNKVTMSPDGILDSRGEVYLNANKNGQPLRLRPGYATIQFEASSYAEPMSFFNGSVSGEFGDVSWNLNTTVAPTNGFYGCSYDTINPPVYIDTATSADICDTLYTFPLDSFGWVNCDRLISGLTPPPTPTDITVNLPGGYEPNATFVYMAFSNLNAVIRLYPINNTESFHIGGAYAPVGRPATIIALSYRNGGWYSCVRPITIALNHTEDLTFTSTTIANYIQQVQMLE